MRRCPDCGKTPEQVPFNRDRSKKDGLMTYCRACSKARSQAWYAANAPKKIAKSRRWNITYRERYNELGRRSYQRHRTQRLMKTARYHRTHRLQQNTYARAWYHRNRDRILAKRRQRQDERARTALDTGASDGEIGA